jgi:hypothetical protein
MLTKRPLTLALAKVAAPILVLSAAEIGLRAARFEYPRERDRAIVWSKDEDAKLRRSDGLYAFDPQTLWSPRPGALLPWTDGERINSDGYRGPQLEVERPKGTLRIATLGGAACFGVGVHWEETYSARLVSLVGERVMPTEVLDAGVGGYTAVQALWRYRDFVRAYRPHVVILSVSDQSILQAPQGRTDLERMNRMRLDPPGLNTGIAGLNWCDDLRVAHLGRWIASVYWGSYWRERDAEFHDRRLDKTVGALDWPGVRRLPIDDFYYALAHLLQETRYDGAHLIFLSIPRSPNLPDQPVRDIYMKSLYDLAEREHVVVVDARSAYLRAVQEDIPKEELFIADQYPSDCGHLQIAQALADVIVEGIAKRR